MNDIAIRRDGYIEIIAIGGNVGLYTQNKCSAVERRVYFRFNGMIHPVGHTTSRMKCRVNFYTALLAGKKIIEFAQLGWTNIEDTVSLVVELEQCRFRC